MQRFVPRAFISYSWDDDEHKGWVKALAARLRNDGVDITLDEWQVRPATRLPLFMEKAIKDNEFVLIVCTEGYKQKADTRKGGVGFEDMMISGTLLEVGNEQQFIPVLRGNEWSNSRPGWLIGATYLDFRGMPYQESAYDRLLDTLFGVLPEAPPLGSRSSAREIDLQYANYDFGVLLRICNRLKTTIKFGVILQGMDKVIGTGGQLQKITSLPIPLVIEEIISPSDCGAWMPIIFTTGADQSEVKIESKDSRVSSFFLHQAGTWRLRIVVVADQVGTDVFSVWLGWKPGEAPKASEDPMGFHLGIS